MFKPLILASALLLAGNVAAAAPVSYKMDPNHTDVVASWSHFGFSNPVAHFGAVDGTIVYDADHVGKSSVKVTIPMSGMNSHVPDFDEHLRSADFFDAEKYPTITFNSTKVEAAGGKKLRVFGDLTAHGVTKPVVLDVTLNRSGNGRDGQPRIGFDATTSFKRSDFGLGLYAPKTPGGVGVSDEVTIRITTEAGVPKTEEAADKKPTKKQ